VIRVFAAIAVLWLALMPPFFADGACTGEFDAVARQIQEHKPSFASLASAREYWNSVHIPVQTISADQCRIAKPRFVDSCGRGDLLYIAVPIQNKVCRLYRDSAVRIQLHYDDHGRLRQLQADMKPFNYFSIPGLGVTLYWAK
jgi:hypothetical protein